MTELKPCPFCGVDSRIVHDSDRQDISIGFISVECWECDGSSGYYCTEQEAIEAWNRRA